MHNHRMNQKIYRAAHRKFLLISLLSLLPSFSLASPSSDKYLEVRDKFIQKFSKNSVSDAEDKVALKELEGLLENVLGNVNVEGFSDKGEINLQTLQPSDDATGFGQADGLVFHSKGEILFVSTLPLLKAYATQNKLPQDLLELSKSDSFYSRVFDWDSAFTTYADIPVVSDKKTIVIRSILIMNAQDIGPFLPSALIVFVQKNDRIYILKSELSKTISQIQACQNIWDEYEAKSTVAFNAYRASNLKDKQSFNDHLRFEEEGFKAYTKCFSSNAKDQPFFSNLVNQAQSMINRIGIVAPK